MTVISDVELVSFISLLILSRSHLMEQDTVQYLCHVQAWCSQAMQFVAPCTGRFWIFECK